MCFLYWRVWRETEKRYKDLTTLFLVSAVGGRVRTAPGHVSSSRSTTDKTSTTTSLTGKVKKGPTNLSRASSREQDANPCEGDEDVTQQSTSGICARLFYFLCYPLIWAWNRFAATDDDEEDDDELDEAAVVGARGGHGVSSLRRKLPSGRTDEMTSTTEDDDVGNIDDYESTSAASSSKGLASDSIYTILITLGSGQKDKAMTTPTTTSSAALTPVAESFDDTMTAGHSIKQFFESAVINTGQEVSSSSRTSSIKKVSKETVREGGGSSSSSWINIKGQHQHHHQTSRSTRLSFSSSSNRPTSAPATAIQSSVSQPKSEKKAAKTLSAILLAFIITWTPYNVLVLIKTLKGDSIDEATSSADSIIPESLWNFSYYLCYINSTINPFCYALCNVNFRNTYIRILKCQWTLRGSRAKRAAANLDAQFQASQAKRKQQHQAGNKIKTKNLSSPEVVSTQVKKTVRSGFNSRSDTMDSSNYSTAVTPSGSKRNSNRCKT